MDLPPEPTPAVRWLRAHISPNVVPALLGTAFLLALGISVYQPIEARLALREERLAADIPVLPVPDVAPGLTTVPEITLASVTTNSDQGGEDTESVDDEDLAEVRPGKLRYKVKSGDTLWEIARAYNTRMVNIMAVNEEVSPDAALKLGLELVLPDDADPTGTKTLTQPQATVKATGSSTKTASGKIKMPVTSYRLTQGFSAKHPGIDLGMPVGTPIYATDAGTISVADATGYNGGYGKTIKISHAGGFSSRYGHLSRIVSGLSVGDAVKKGELIGYSGNTGRSTGPHLHFEYRAPGGVAKDPRKFM